MLDDEKNLDLDEILSELDAMDVRQNQARPLKKKKNNLWITILFIVVLVICAVVITYGADYLIDYWADAKKQEALYDKLADLVDQSAVPSPPTYPLENTTAPTDDDPDAPSKETQPATPTDPTAPTEPPVPTEPVILPEYQAIYQLNNDLVGWISIPGTKINYPVMQSPEDPNYYLTHDFEKNYNAGGCIYARKQCDVFKPSDNIILYGHHMKSGAMFADLDEYMKQPFWEEHQTFSFNTVYERHTYQIIAVFKASASGYHKFDYHLFNDAASQEEFDEFMAQIHERQLYDTGLTAQYGDKLLTLSTCNYSLYDGRLAILAKRIS